MKKFKVFALVFAIMLSATGLGLLFGSNQPASTQAKVSAAETTDTNWYTDWNYTPNSDSTISLTAYNGTETTYTVPATATIDGKVYSVIFGSGSPETGKAQVNLGTITSLSFETEVEFPTNSKNLFYRSKLTSLNLTGVDTSKVTDMNGMFYCCSSLTGIEFGNNFDTSNVTNMNSMFYGCKLLTSLDLSSFDTSNVTNMNGMFYRCSKLTSITFGDKFYTSKVTSMNWMFSGCKLLTSLDLSSFNTSIVTSMEMMFQNCSSLSSLDLSGFDTSNVTYMDYMFYGCSKLTSITFGDNFNTSKVENMHSMFSGCSKLASLDLINFDTSNVIDMGSMFYDCSKLEGIKFPQNFGLKAYDPEENSSDEMNYMFSNCSSLESLDLSKFNTNNVTSMCEMFSGCSKLTSLDLSNFNTSNVTSMWDMFSFSGCTSLQNIKMPNIMNKSSTITLNALSLPSQSTSGTAIKWYSLASGAENGTPVVANNKVSTYAGNILTINQNNSYAEIDKIIANATKPSTPSTPSTGVVLNVVLPVASIVLVLASLVVVAFVGKKKKQY